ncbi:Alcaligin biosynthesis enzyme [Salinisphaera orenii MK-B5]|uniref:Alcaligin biosynthesis enzyme n=2 Tax=Salinisphaera TaxID=180541 RepID=A0A423PML8_9GAMM|nr:Alcaligin biosynthesis enzyme [Salinisphaera orenii MK-B5]
MVEPAMHIHDVAGIGIGPFNLGLAALSAPIDDLDAVFIDENDHFDWHPGLLLEGATLQTPFMADLVTLADPTSDYSFLNYLKQTGRIYAFYIREQFHMLRAEYNQYCRWVCERLDNLIFGTRVVAVAHDAAAGCYTLTLADTATGARRELHARALVLGTGPDVHVPACCRELGGRVVHASAFAHERARLQAGESITVVGSGQSAAEVFHALLAEQPRHGYRLDWFTRSPRFFALNYDKLTLEMTSPEYVDYFHGLSEHRRHRLGEDHKSLYKGIDESLINAIYDLMYERDVAGTLDVGLQANVELRDARHDAVRDTIELDFVQHEQGAGFTHRSASLVLATGFAYRVPDYIDGIADRIRWDEQGRFDVSRDYAVDHANAEIFVQNAEIHTHGFVTPDLGMACYRNACILRALTGVEHYPIERRIAFQQFAVQTPDTPAVNRRRTPA